MSSLVTEAQIAGSGRCGGILAAPDDPRYFPPDFDEHLTAAFRGEGPMYECYRSYMRSEISRGREIERLLKPWTGLAGKDVLDVGCGFGGLLIVMKEAGAATITGVEIEDARIHWARARMQSLGYAANIEKLDICDSQAVSKLPQFDVILVQDAIEHVEDPRSALYNIAGRLRPGGVVYLQVGNKFAPEQLRGDHHYQLPGITMLSRPQAREYVKTRLGIPEDNYAVGYWREEKYYRHVFKQCGVNLHRTEHYPTPQHMLAFADSVSEVCRALEGNLWPDLRPELALRMRRRMRKLVELYVHASRLLPQVSSDLNRVEQICDAVVDRLLIGVWRLVGIKEDQPRPAASKNSGVPDRLT